MASSSRIIALPPVEIHHSLDIGQGLGFSPPLSNASGQGGDLHPIAVLFGRMQDHGVLVHQILHTRPQRGSCAPVVWNSHAKARDDGNSWAFPLADDSVNEIDCPGVTTRQVDEDI